MFDAHAPFQIDGNFGCCAGIAEMLLQSHAGFVHLLPALPSAWSEGHICGLRARGGFEIADMQWNQGQIISVKIKSTIGGNLRLRSNTPLKMADGTLLTAAAGTNPNPLNREYKMPSAIVADKSKIPSVTLPTTYVYDIPTTAGQEIELIHADASSIVMPEISGDENSDASIYNAAGIKVDNNYKGIVVSRKQKIIKK